MTPQRWQRINELFEAASRIDPSRRQDWLEGVCDAELRDDVARLLANDERARREGFLTLKTAPGQAIDPGTISVTRGADGWAAPAGRAGHETVGSAAGGFTPTKAIASVAPPEGTSEFQTLCRSRLRTVALMHLLILVLLPLWRITALRSSDPILAIAIIIAVTSLAAIVSLLSSRRSLSLGQLRLVAFSMVCLLAGLLALDEYRVLLKVALHGQPRDGQLVMQNVVLATSILVLSFGLYLPHSGRRAAVLAGPIALVPFVTLGALALRRPEASGWLGREGLPPVQIGADAMLLLILVLGAVYGAHSMDRLRRELDEARQLGQYRLGRRIGSGGMGEVYLAEHRLLKRPCALKLIRPGATADPQVLERFEREVRLTATLAHSNIINVYDYGRTEDGTYYYVMEYVAGLNLAEFVDRHGPLPPARAVYLLRQVCRALGAAHAAGLIHRDIKPANILITPIGGTPDLVKLLDFGLVRAVVETHEPRLTAEGRILGTPSFMSPEQATGDQGLDERSDLYSLGGVGYYLLTGRAPFKGEDIIRVMMAHAHEPVVPPSEMQAGIPEDLERVILRCLAKRAADRFPDAASVEHALAECTCATHWDPQLAAEWWQGADPVTVITPTARTSDPDHRARRLPGT
jgi:serine/threonine-protein kinase